MPTCYLIRIKVKTDDMPLHSENTKWIAKNTLMLYVRMLFGMLVSLYTSRVVLNTLGVEDYGINNVVGGIAASFSLVSGALSYSVSRFLTFELGRGDMIRLKRIFSTALSIQFVLIVIVFVLMETAGVWFLNNYVTIPSERIYAANWVFQANVFCFLLGLASVPYNASIISHERMKVFAYMGILDVILRLLAVLFIAYSPWAFDRMIVYSLLLVAVMVLLQFFYFHYCWTNFEECRSWMTFDKKYWKEISSFAGWNFVGSTACIAKDQGVNILLNMFYAPIVNAARGISITVSAVVSSFASNFMTALNPQITKSYASGDYGYVFNLVERGTRFSFYILFILSLPILFETEFVLTIWLKEYPDHTINFVRLVLILSLMDSLSNTLITLQAATGKIRNYQLVVGGMLLMNFPLSYVCLRIGMPSESVFCVALFVSICCFLLRLLMLRINVNLSIRWFLKKVCFNVLLVVLCSIIIPIIIYVQMQDGWSRFFAVCIACLASSSISAYLIGCSISERIFIRDQIIKRIFSIVGVG